VDFFFFFNLKWESGTSSELSGASDRVGRAVFQQKQYVGATINTANIALQMYAGVCFENEDLQDIRS
jgi:hypothetical protein